MGWGQKQVGRPGKASDKDHGHPGWHRKGEAPLAELSSAHPALAPLPSGVLSRDSTVLSQEVTIPHLTSFSSRISMSSVSSLQA